MNQTKRIFLVLFSLSLIFLYSWVALASPVEWHSYDEGMALAKEQNKPVMIDFYADWCGYCKKLDSETYADSDVIKMSEDFINIKVDTEVQGNLAQKYGVRVLPTIVFTDSDGNEIRRVVGYKNADAFLLEMKAAIDGEGGPTEATSQTPGFGFISSLIILLLTTVIFECRMRK